MPPPDVCGELRVSRGLWGPRESAGWERSGLAPPCLRGRLREAAGFLRLGLRFLRLGGPRVLGSSLLGSGGTGRGGVSCKGLGRRGAEGVGAGNPGRLLWAPVRDPGVHLLRR